MVSLATAKGVNSFVTVLNVPFLISVYEYPVCTGISMYNMLESTFNDHSLRVLLFESGLMMHGKPLEPPSRKDVPGPPGIQIVVGAFCALFLASELLSA